MTSRTSNLLGTCGTVINTPTTWTGRWRIRSRAHLPRDERSVAVHAARLHARVAEGGARRGRRSPAPPPGRYLSHYVANHMFLRIALPRARASSATTSTSATATCEVEPDVGGRPAHAAGGRHARRVDGLHACRRRSRTRATASPAAWDPRRLLRASPSSSTSRSRSSRRSPITAPARPHLSAGCAREQLGARIRFVAVQVPPDSGVDLSGQQPLNTSPASPSTGDGRHLRRPAVRCTPTPSTRRCPQPTRFGARIAVNTRTSCSRGAPHGRDRPARTGGSTSSG